MSGITPGPLPNPTSELSSDPITLVAYFCHHLSDNYIDLSDLYVILSDLYVILSLIHMLENKS